MTTRKRMTEEEAYADPIETLRDAREAFSALAMDDHGELTEDEIAADFVARIDAILERLEKTDGHG